MFIGWFLVFTFVDWIFVKVKLFDQANHNSHYYTKNLATETGKSDLGDSARINTSGYSKNHASDNSNHRVSLLSRPENYISDINGLDF